MRVLGIDFETTGLDLEKDRITEVGAVLWDTETKAPIQFYSHFLHDTAMEERFSPETLAMMKRLCGITPELLRDWGRSPTAAFVDLGFLAGAADYIVAHNGNQFDKPFLMNELKRHGVDNPLKDKPWLDTKVDLPHETPPDSNKLKHLALEQGFINPFAHRAVFDVLTMLRVLSNFDLEKVIAYSKEPSIVIRAVVPHPKQDQGKGKDMAKAAGFRWQEVDYKIYDLCWVKKIKASKLEEERKKLPDYQIVVLP